jgi:hypothetical protein
MPYSSTISNTTSARLSPDWGLAAKLFSTITAIGLEPVPREGESDTL